MNNYESFIKEFDEQISKLIDLQKKYIYCKEGCSYCCEKGDYPFSQIEFNYLTQGFINLDTEEKIIVQKNIKKLLEEKKNFTGEKFEHVCPFLINKKCCVYDYRGIICRTFGICYYDEENKYVRLPECVNLGLNYSQYYDKKEKILKISDVPMVNLRIDKVLTSELAKKYNIKLGEIRPMLEWLDI